MALPWPAETCPLRSMSTRGDEEFPRASCRAKDASDARHRTGTFAWSSCPAASRSHQARIAGIAGVNPIWLEFPQERAPADCNRHIVVVRLQAV